MARREHAQARLFGVLGDPVDHSLSPVMQNAAFAAAGLPHLYLRYRVPPAALAAALREAKALGMGGLNLTVPLKEAVLPLLDALTPAAERAAAVNTIILSPGGRLLGDNTDGEGFVRALGGRARGARAVVIGAGGSGAAVAAALSRAGAATVTIANRTVARAERLAARLAGPRRAKIGIAPLTALASGAALEDATLVVNATPLTAPDEIAPLDAIAPPAALVDLVYGETLTPWIERARGAGRAAWDGLGLLVFQARRSLALWTGREVPVEPLARAVGWPR